MQKMLDDELCPGERILWSQQPRPAALARRSMLMFLFGIPFFAFAVFWTIGASDKMGSAKAKGDPFPSWFPILWGGMFILFGACLLLSPLWACWCALRTVYAITDKRAILIQAPWRRTVHSFVGERLADIHRVENSAGAGDLIFHREARSGRRGDSYYDVGFLGIENVREVEDRIRELLARTRGA